MKFISNLPDGVLVLLFGIVVASGAFAFGLMLQVLVWLVSS